MSQENVEIVKRAVAALNERDVDRYLAGCTEDIEVRTPLAPVSGIYQGPDDVRRYFANIQDTSLDLRLELERVEAIGADRVLAFLHVTGSWRASGIPAAAGRPTANLYDLLDGKIRRVQIFLERQEALEAAGLLE